MFPRSFFVLFVPLFCSLLASGQTKEPASGTYYIRSALGRYLDVQWGNPDNGTQMHLWDFNGGAAQKWHIKKDPGGFFTIKSDLGRCLDVPNGKGEMGLMPQLWDCYAGAPQVWVFSFLAESNSWVIQSAAGTVLDVQNANPAAGTPVWMYPFNGSVAQLWYLEPVPKTATPVRSADHTPGQIPILIRDFNGNIVGKTTHIEFYLYYNGIPLAGFDTWHQGDGRVMLEKVPPGAYTLKAFYTTGGGLGDEWTYPEKYPLSPDEHTVVVPPGRKAGEVEFRIK